MENMNLETAMQAATDAETKEAYEEFVADVRYRMKRIEKLSAELQEEKRRLKEMQFLLYILYILFFSFSHNCAIILINLQF